MDYNKFKAPASAIRRNLLGVRPPQNWPLIIRYLQSEECVGIRMKLCISCGFGKLYDKKGNEIKVSQYFTLARVKEIVNMIKAQEQ